MDTDEKYVQIPEEYSRRKLNALYREIPLKDTTSRLLRKYFNAMANLYGVILLGKALEIIDSQNPGLVTKEEFFAFAEIARHECEDYCILRDDELYLDGKMTGRLDWLIIDIPLLCDRDSDAAFREVRICQQGKDYYIPMKTELLRYDDNTYCEPTPQAQRMRNFLLKTLQLEPREADIAFEEILLQTRCLGGGLQAMIDVVEEVGGTFSNRQMTEFVAIQQDFNNNTRMHHNRGYTPNEILAMAKPEDRVLKSLAFGPGIRKSLADGSMDPDKLRRDFLTMDVPDEHLRTLMLQALDEAQVSVPKAVKIGRNDPCPCGSGKKYKKCCGR